jgi:hypothetical protein
MLGILEQTMRAMDHLADREQWLAHHGSSEEEVRLDEDGREFIASVEEDEDGEINFRNIYLPVELF